MRRPRKGEPVPPESYLQPLEDRTLEVPLKEFIPKTIEYYLQKLKTFITTHPKREVSLPTT